MSDDGKTTANNSQSESKTLEDRVTVIENAVAALTQELKGFVLRMKYAVNTLDAGVNQ